MAISGIYKIQSKCKPERCYIGSAINIQNRWSTHLCQLRKNKHGSKKLQNHYNKYGEADLLFSVLLGCDKIDLLKHEQYFIDACNPYFNYCKIAGSVLGVKWKLSKEAIEARKHRPGNRLGHKLSEETKRKISINSRSRTPEARKRASERFKGMVSPMKGRKTTDAAKLKQSIAHTGKSLSEYHKRKISEALKGVKKPPRTEKHKALLGKSKIGKSTWMKGRHHTEETKKKISIAANRALNLKKQKLAS